MRHLVRCLPLAAAAALYAQAPNRIDNEQVRVGIGVEQPHRRGPMHEHQYNRVQIYLTDGVTTLTKPDGKVQRVEYKAGDVRWSPADGPHQSENITDNAVRIVEIDLKGKPQPHKASDLDPLKTDSKHYKLEFENEQVRVLRIRFGPNEKGVPHEHTMNRVVVYLNDQSRGKAGEFRLETPAAHTEENPLDRAVERIAIDIK